MFVSTMDSSERVSDHENCAAVVEGDEDVTNKWRYNLFCGCSCNNGELYTAALYW
jgi:hypothetical protein